MHTSLMSKLNYRKPVTLNGNLFLTITMFDDGNNEKENALKGQRMSAQGKQSGALGWRTDSKIVRAIRSIIEKILFRTKHETLYFPKMMYCNSVRRNDVALINIFTRTVFPVHLLPRAVFRFVPHETIPWATHILPFQGGKKASSTPSKNPL